MIGKANRPYSFGNYMTGVRLFSSGLLVFLAVLFEDYFADLGRDPGIA